MTSYQVFRNTVIILLTLVLAYLLFLTTRVTVTLLISVIIASAVRPVVMRLNRYYIPYGLAIVLVYLLMAVSIVVLLVAVLPPVVNQVAGYLQNDDRLASRIIYAQYWVERLISQNTGREVELLQGDEIRAAVRDAVGQITTSAPAMLTSVGELLGDFVLVFVMGIYWLTSRDRAVSYIGELFPIGKRQLARTIISEIEVGMGAYVRGLATISIIVGLLNFLILTLLRVPSAATLGFIAGTLTAVPIVGGFLGVILTTGLVLLISPTHALLVLLTTVGVQQVENYVLTPRIMSASVGFDEILVLVLVAAGFALNGIVGALLAVPISGAIYVLIRYLILEPRKMEIKPETVKGGILLKQQEQKRNEESSEAQ